MSDELVPIEQIKNRIYFIRGQKVMLDRDLAELYDIETKNLNKAAKRNIERFPERYMFQLTNDELENLRFQFVTANLSVMSRNLPYVFTERGIAMLSSVLNSKRAIQINIQIMDAFVEMRHYLINKGEIEQVLKDIIDKRVEEVLDAVYKLVEAKISGVSISNITNSTITLGDVTIGGTTKWADEAYGLIQKVLADLEGVKLSGKTKEVIKTNSELLIGLLEEGKPARRRLKDTLNTIKTTLEMAAAGNALASAVLERIHQILKLIG